MSWLERLSEATKDAESPREFIFWAGISAIAAVTRKNVYLDKFYYKLYPNIYVLLVAKSGMRKGFPVSLCKTLTEGADSLKIISGRNSIQAVLKDLGHVQTKPGVEGPMKGSQAILISGEFSSFIVDDPSALTILTDLYDTHANVNWKNTLKHSGTDTLKDVCLSFLGATNQSHFKDRISAVDTTGGFVARTLLVVADKKGKINSLVDKPDITFDAKEFIPGLREISKITGEFQYTPAGKKLYKDWYEDFNSKEHDDKTGTSDRIHDNILKVAMLVSLSNRGDLLLDVPDIELAIEKCIPLITNVNRVTAGTGKGQLSNVASIILQELISAPANEVARSKMLQKYWGEFDHFELDRIIETMMQGNAIEQYTKGKMIWYKMKPETLALYKRLSLK